MCIRDRLLGDGTRLEKSLREHSNGAIQSPSIGDREFPWIDGLRWVCLEAQFEWLLPVGAWQPGLCRDGADRSWARHVVAARSNRLRRPTPGKRPALGDHQSVCCIQRQTVRR